MRCWTDGNRSAFWKNGRLDWVCGDETLSSDGFDKAGSFGPQGALAVHPTRKQVRGLAERAVDPELSDFERFHAQICLAGDRDVDLDGLQVDEVLDATLRDHIEEATINEQTMRVDIKATAHQSGLIAAATDEKPGVRPAEFKPPAFVFTHRVNSISPAPRG